MLPGIKDAASAISSLWNYYRPPKSGDPLVDRWRVRIACGLLLVLLALIGHMIVSEVLPWQGPVARAQEADELNEKLNRVLEQSTKTYKIALAQEICKLHFLRQEASGRLHETLNTQFEEKQDEYATFNEKRRYILSECAPPKAKPSE